MKPGGYWRVMARFRVAFDGEWQADFDSLPEAVEWAREVSETGRMSWVVEERAWGLRSHLRAAFPDERSEEARHRWQATKRGAHEAGGFST